MLFELIDFQLTLQKAFETSLSVLRMPALLNPLVSPCGVHETKWNAIPQGSCNLLKTSSNFLCYL